MATAEDFINAALRKIGVKSSEVPLKTSELTEALELLNDMGAQLESDGFELGYTELAAIGDTATIPAYANNFYKTALGARLAAEYGVEISQTLAADVQSAKEAVIRTLNRKVVGVTGSYQNIIYSAMELLNVKSGSEPITTTEIENALPLLNDMMSELEASGFDLEYIPSAGGDIGSPSGLPSYSLSWIKSLLSIRLAHSYGTEPNQALAFEESSARAAVVRNLNRKTVGVTGSYQNIIYSAMEMLGVKAGPQPITVSEINNALPVLNDLLVELESMGFNFGYTMSSGDDLSSNSGLPDFTLSWIKSTLAIRLATSYGMNVSQELIKMNSEAQSAIYKRSADLPTVSFSDTMPLGSGNSVSGWSGDNFYIDSVSGGISDSRDRPITDDIGVILNDGDLP